jgi:hypothetical protein
MTSQEIHFEERTKIEKERTRRRKFQASATSAAAIELERSWKVHAFRCSREPRNRPTDTATSPSARKPISSNAEFAKVRG